MAKIEEELLLLIFFLQICNYYVSIHLQTYCFLYSASV